jgi:large repetitive protein
VGNGPNDVQSYLACTVFNGSTWTSSQSGLVDWGYAVHLGWLGPEVPLGVLHATLPLAEQGVKLQAVLRAVGGTTPFTWSLLSGHLPIGLRLSSAGRLTGSPASAGTFAFEVRVTDGNGDASNGTVHLRVARPLTISNSRLAEARVGKSYSARVSAEGGVGPFEWTLVRGIKPAGLTFSKSGAWSGRPTASGRFRFVVEVTDALGRIATRALSIVVS